MNNNQARAFPGPLEGDSKGMTLREYYAGQALAGLCANANVVMLSPITGWAQPSLGMEQVAFEIADAMIAEGEKK